MQLTLQHLGMSGLRLTLDGKSVCVDPPAAVPGETAILTWSEAERVAGVQGAKTVLAHPDILTWLGISGLALTETAPVTLGSLAVSVMAYRPIPYATPPEAMRKTLLGLRRPRFAIRRLVHTLSRPSAPPLALRLDWSGLRIGLCQQALHRFVDANEANQLQAFFSDCDVAIASPDFEYEAACGRLLGELGARHSVLIDSIGPVRRMLGLPTRPLRTSLATAPEGTVLVEDGEGWGVGV
jgi:hypothetical protein